MIKFVKSSHLGQTIDKIVRGKDKSKKELKSRKNCGFCAANDAVILILTELTGILLFVELSFLPKGSLYYKLVENLKNGDNSYLLTPRDFVLLL